MKRLAVIYLIMIGVSLSAHPITLYNTCYNSFERLRFNSQATISGQFMQLDNTSTSDIILTDSTSIDRFIDYKYYIKFANLHNIEGKSYKVTDHQGNSATLPSTRCGIVFNLTAGSYWLVTIGCNSTSLFDENFYSRTMTLELAHVAAGQKRVVQQATLDKGLDLGTGYNYLGVSIDGNVIKVLAGNDKLNEILSYTITQSEIENDYGIPSRKVGIFVGAGAMISLERTVLSFNLADSNEQPSLETHWTREALDRHFAESKNPFEGYWTYLDRDMEDRWLKLGGRYTIALVETTQGYDVIYVDGAQVKHSQWHLGMKKAEMTKTIFTDNFTGTWYDATHEAISQDVYVTFESGVILTFKFPVYKSQVRFSKVVDRERDRGS